MPEIANIKFSSLYRIFKRAKLFLSLVLKAIWLIHLPDERIIYNCINCGECCKRLLIERQGVLKGLPLLPSEKILFHEGIIKPGFGIGESGSRNFKIISYQMTRGVCPNHIYNGCSVWTYRPAICRAYPIVPVISQGMKIVKTFDMTCTALKDYASKYDGLPIPLEPMSVESERQGYDEVVKITEAALEKIDKTWFYDLRTKKWVPFKNMLSN